MIVTRPSLDPAGRRRARYPAARARRHQPEAARPTSTRSRTWRASGIAFKLAQALVRANQVDPLVADLPLRTGDLLDLVALGTVADIAPLVGENRLLVRRGLRLLNGTVRTNGASEMHVTHLGPRRPGLRALFGEAGLQPGKVTAQTIGFVIGPRLNAAGRLIERIDRLRLCSTHRLRTRRASRPSSWAGSTATART